MTTYFSDFLGSIFWGFLILYLIIYLFSGMFGLRDFFSYRFYERTRTWRSRD